MYEVSARIKDRVNSLHQSPGIYKFFDSYGNIIYVGKSKRLKDRVNSYFRGEKIGKIKKMISVTKDIEVEYYDTHIEAMLRECSLIKELKPYFNRQFKNHSRYLYFNIEDKKINTPITISELRKSKSYGPFRSRTMLDKLINSFENIYPLTIKNKEYIFEYKVVPKIMTEDEFNINKCILTNLFERDSNLVKFINKLEEKMHSHAAKVEYEQSIYYRDFIEILKWVRKNNNLYKDLSSLPILLRIPVEDKIKLFFVYRGLIINKSQLDCFSKKEVSDFIKTSKNLLTKDFSNIDEKELLDYMSIIYSEISNLPPCML